jgi:glycosyltransferase involved in cell wall biosynthesis
VVSIFVSIAAYRDPELVPTVLDCLAKAKHPDELRIVVNWQHLGDEDVSAIRDDPRVEIIEFDARQSRGACWARAEIMRHYRPADWFLQVDSHTRFAQDWDVRCIAAALSTGAAKPILSGYPPMYDPGSEFTGAGEPTRIIADDWTGDGVPTFRQEVVPQWRTLGRPERSRFLAAGFLFAPGSFPLEVPYDPNIYFHGEEITLSVRAYTWGYDLFHPTEVLTWHFYIREQRPRHWDDHDGSDSGRHWYAREKASRRRVGNILRYPAIGRLAMGPVRPAAAYAEYAGIDFHARTYTEHARAGHEPPEPAVAAIEQAQVAVDVQL